MKRNLIPLLAVAFVVAIVSTGIFYGLFAGKLKSAPVQTIVIAATALRPGVVVAKADLGTLEWSSSQIPAGMFTSPDQVAGQTILQGVDQGEPILQSHLISKTGAGLGVPEGMRAVSVHVSDSSGILALLRPGYKVDAQVFATRQTEKGGHESEARTAFQNLKVLGVSPQAEPSSQGGFNAPVVTLLASPRDADALGLADSFGKIRLALRNPVDESAEERMALPLAAVFRGRSQESARPNRPASRPTEVRRAEQSQVGLSVELLSASPEAITALKRYGVTGRQDVLDASQGGAAGELEKTLARLRDDKAVDVLSLSQVNAAMSRSASVELKSRAAGGLRVQFSPFISHGQMKLRVEPEMTVDEGTAPGIRRLETEVDITAGKSFVISGLKDPTSNVDGRQILVLVTPHL